MLNNIFDMGLNTHLSNMMGQQSDCPHRERFGYTGDMLGTLHTSLALFDGRTFYEKRLLDVADALTAAGAVTETAPYVGVGVGGPSTDKYGPIGWDTVFPVMQEQLVRHHGNYHGTSAGSPTVRNATARWMAFLENQTAKFVEGGLGDWEAVGKMPKSISGRIFLRMNYEAWGALNGMGGLGDPALAMEYGAKAANETVAFNKR
jgi:alpha-L-rhamnosidase